MARIEYRLGGASTTVLAGEQESVLDCALRNNIPAPYSCLEGVCQSCTATLVQGEVETFIGGFDPTEKLVQTCQVRIRKSCELLVIDYDKT